MVLNSCSISVVILTYNEEVNLPACLDSLKGLACEVFVVDSGSTDRTAEIARSYGAEVALHEFQTQAQQLNWALDHLTFKGDWVLRMDADERLTPELAQELVTRLPTFPPAITGLYLKRRTYFMGRWIRYGGYYPTWILRVWRTGKAQCEGQYLNEHMILLEGTAAQLTQDFIDWNLKGLGFWVEKHNHYATRFARELTALQDGSSAHITSIKATPFGTQEQRKRWLKQQVYARLPLFFRSFVYFVYRYVFLGGFLDGKEGLMFHFLQGFWYHFLVDAKVYELAKHRQP
jgi:glycosyltransferase involved in cell wall biosynthesis